MPSLRLSPRRHDHMSPLPSLPLREEGTLTGNGTATSPLSVVSPYTGVTHDGTLTGNGTPASPLKVTSPYTGVAHDGTLTGNGTLASPLSVAAPAGGSLTVFDANGALVGKYDGGVILRKLGDTWMRLGYEDVNGVVASSIGGTLVLYYETTDCTGPAYLPGEFGLVGSAYSGVPPYTTIVFAVGPPLTITARAIGEDNIDFLEPNHLRCTTLPGAGGTARVRAKTSFDLTTLGLVLPFRVE